MKNFGNYQGIWPKTRCFIIAPKNNLALIRKSFNDRFFGIDLMNACWIRFTC
jgi:hypothetical protein